MIDEFDLGTDMMWRDEWRRENLGYEQRPHLRRAFWKTASLVTGSAEPMKGCPRRPGVFRNRFPGAGRGGRRPSAGLFSSYKRYHLTYDAANQTYLVGQFGEAQMDGNLTMQNTRQNAGLVYPHLQPGRRPIAADGFDRQRRPYERGKVTRRRHKDSYVALLIM